MAKSRMKNDRRQRGQLQSPYGLLTLTPLAKRQSIQVNINSASELIRPPGLSKQWGPPQTFSRVLARVPQKLNLISIPQMKKHFYLIRSFGNGFAQQEINNINFLCNLSILTPWDLWKMLNFAQGQGRRPAVSGINHRNTLSISRINPPQAG